MVDGNFDSCPSIPVGMTLNNASPVKAQTQANYSLKDAANVLLGTSSLRDQKFWGEPKAFNYFICRKDERNNNNGTLLSL